MNGQTEFQRWGNWRESNSTTRHSRSCFDVEVENKEDLQFWNASNEEEFILIE